MKKRAWQRKGWLFLTTNTRTPKNVFYRTLKVFPQWIQWLDSRFQTNERLKWTPCFTFKRKLSTSCRPTCCLFWGRRQCLWVVFLVDALNIKIKPVSLHIANILSSFPVAHSVEVRETYVNMKNTFYSLPQIWLLSIALGLSCKRIIITKMNWHSRNKFILRSNYVVNPTFVSQKKITLWQLHTY